MTTIIRSNGSKFAGDPADTLDQLIDAMGREALAPKFEDYGDFAAQPTSTFLDAIDAEKHDLNRSRVLHFWGNFENLSHVFDILTDDEDVIARLIAAIKANKATPAYKVAKQDWLEEKRRRKVAAAASERSRLDQIRSGRR